MKKYDLIGLGCSMSSYALESFKKDFPEVSVAVIDPTFEPTCPTKGCVQKKFVYNEIDKFIKAKAGLEEGTLKGKAKLNFSKVTEKARSQALGVSEAYKKSFQHKGIDVYEGFGEFISSNEVKVNNQILKGEKFVIATGARPRRINDIAENALPTSNEFFNMNELPKSVIVNGAGYIGFELGHFLSLAGSDVKIVYRGKEEKVLKEFDSKMVKYVLKEEKFLPFYVGNFKKEKRSLERFFDTEIKKVEKKDRKYIAHTSKGILEADWFLNATGRIPNTEIGLDKAGVEFDKRGIIINEFMKTSNPNIYAAGDVVGKIKFENGLEFNSLKLTTSGGYEGEVVMENIMGKKRVIDPTLFTTIAFGFPQIASVGLRSQDISKKNKEEYNSFVEDISGWTFPKKSERLFPYIFNFIIKKDSKRLVGAHLVGYDIVEDINYMGNLVRSGFTFGNKERGFYRKDAWPSLSYDLLQNLEGKLND